MSLLQPLLLTALICLIVGFAAGYLAASGRAEKDERPAGIVSPVQGQPSYLAAPPATSYASPAPGPPLVQPAGSTAQPAQVVPRPSLNPVDAIARALQPDKDRQAAPKSITAQVDEILQEKLAQASPAESRAVRLVEEPEKGVVVMIGMDSYEGVDTVPDPRIRELIHLSVEEWENQAPQNQKPN